MSYTRAGSDEARHQVIRVVLGYRKEIAELAAKSRLPVIHADAPSVEAGALISYGVNLSDLDRRAATYVDKILKVPSRPIFP